MYTSVLGKINKLHKKIIDQIMDRVSKQTVSSSITFCTGDRYIIDAFSILIAYFRNSKPPSKLRALPWSIINPDFCSQCGLLM
jgi:hypothetical protein